MGVVAPRVQGMSLTSRQYAKSPGFAMASNRRRQYICEDEYIGEISGSVAFATTSFAFNPGQVGTFPWGSRVAQLYEKYKTVSAEFYYKREVSEFATNGNAGKVILSFDYDATDSQPTTKQQVEDLQPHVDGMPCENLVLKLDPKQLNGQDSKYIRIGVQPANTDLKTYDGGFLNVSTQGCANTTTIGELHVRYCFELLVPVLEGALPVNAGGVANGLTAMTAANPFGTGGSLDAQSAGVTLSNASVLSFALPGTYLVSLEFVGTVISALTATAGAGATATSLAPALILADQTAGTHSFDVVTTTANATVAITATATTITTSIAWIGVAPAGSLT